MAREFRRLLDGGARLLAAGEARRRPQELLSRGYGPKYKVRLLDTTFYLSKVLQNPALRFFVGYVAQPRRHGGKKIERIHARIFYKDVSLIWRAASHAVWTEEEFWIGKGAVLSRRVGDEEYLSSNESTTDLPLEIQDAFEQLNRRGGRVRTDEASLALVLRCSTRERIEPYRDFTEPRRRAAAVPGNRINRGRRVAYFARKNVPESLRFVRGFEPDFARGVLERTRSTSAMYGGRLRRFRIVSRNREIQYLFFAGRRHVWIIPPQATTTELSSFGLRTIDVAIDDDLCVPGFEYHYLDDSTDPPSWFSQIPKGFAGRASRHDESRADASAWLDRLPVIREFRRKVLG